MVHTKNVLKFKLPLNHKLACIQYVPSFFPDIGANIIWPFKYNKKRDPREQICAFRRMLNITLNC